MCQNKAQAQEKQSLRENTLAGFFVTTKNIMLTWKQ
jgi:hypothetical protein